MKSRLPKVLHPLLGQPLISYPIKAIEELGIKDILIIIGTNGQQIKDIFGDRFHYVLQDPPLGTGDALIKAIPYISESKAEQVLVVPGDAPFITGEVLKLLLDHHLNSDASATIFTTLVENPTGYGRVVRDKKGEFSSIIEESDASPEEALIKEINASVYVFKGKLLESTLPLLKPNNNQGEYYLTDVLKLLKNSGHKVEIMLYLDDPSVCQGINSRKELARMHTILRERLLNTFMDRGVTVIDPCSTFVEIGVSIEPDVTINPFTFLLGKTEIKKGSVIGPMAMIKDSMIGENCLVYLSELESAVLEEGVRVGPFSHLRPDTLIKKGAKIGNFAEIKKSTIGKGTKVPHLSYLGDATLGESVNIGAGTIICNYDGERKHPTTIDDGVFVGSNSTLIAPLKIGKDAYIGAGSVINQDVPPEALALGREKQVNKEKWVSKRRERRKRNG